MGKPTIKELEQKNAELEQGMSLLRQEFNESQNQAKRTIQSLEAELSQSKSNSLDQIIEKGQENKQLKITLQNINNQLVELAQAVGISPDAHGSIQIQAFSDAIQSLVANKAPA